MNSQQDCFNLMTDISFAALKSRVKDNFGPARQVSLSCGQIDLFVNEKLLQICNTFIPGVSKKVSVFDLK